MNGLTASEIGPPGAVDPGRAAGPVAPAGPSPAHDRAWESRTARWVEQGIIDEAQARHIVELESAPAGSRSTLLAEVLGYFGAALMVAAMAALMGDRWSDIAFAGQVAIVGAATTVGGVTGAIARRRGGAAFTRMASLLWFATVGGVAGLAALMARDGFDLGDEATVVAVLSAAAVAAIAFYVVHPHWLQLVAVIGTTAGLVAACLNLAGVEFSPTYGFLLMAIGATWVLESLKPVLGPASAATIGGAAVYFAGCMAMTDEWLVAGLALLALGSAVMLASSVLTRNILYLVLGAIGLFNSLPSLAVELFGESIGAPLALLVAGAVILTVALRMRRSTGRDDGEPPQGVTASGASPAQAPGR